MSAPGRALARRLAALIAAEAEGRKNLKYPCGHPRTTDNTKSNGSRPGGRCRICQQAHEKAAQQRRRDREKSGE